jgi:hypothetical protein
LGGLSPGSKNATITKSLLGMATSGRIGLVVTTLKVVDTLRPFVIIVLPLPS